MPPKDSKFEPVVSILIPAFNEEKVIKRLLSRITKITYSKEKLQVIVIDDASSDKTSKIADEYKNNYSLIDVLHRDKSNGKYRNFIRQIYLFRDKNKLEEGQVCEF